MEEQKVRAGWIVALDSVDFYADSSHVFSCVRFKSILLEGLTLGGELRLHTGSVNMCGMSQSSVNPEPMRRR